MNCATFSLLLLIKSESLLKAVFCCCCCYGGGGLFIYSVHCALKHWSWAWSSIQALHYYQLCTSGTTFWRILTTALFFLPLESICGEYKVWYLFLLILWANHNSFWIFWLSLRNQHVPISKSPEYVCFFLRLNNYLRIPPRNLPQGSVVVGGKENMGRYLS